MALPFPPFRNFLIVAFATLCVFMLSNETGFGPAPTQAQTFIENLLKRDAQKTQRHRKRSAAKQGSKPPAVKRKSSAAQKPEARANPPAAIPVPTPAPRPEHAQKDEAVPAVSPDEPPVPTHKPAPPAEKPNPPQPMDEKSKPSEQARSEKEERIYQVACPALISGDVEGVLLPPIEDGAQCGAHSPLSLTAIGKYEPLKFANPITTDCAMAVSLAQWSENVKKAATDSYGSNVRITEIGTGSDYQCRKVNGASTGRVSEHAFANALDIMSFTFSDGSKTELASGWNGSDKEKTFWRDVHRASCKLFMTVIGPDGDAAHRTNMHLDQGCHGKSCLARICQ